jgi:hypothetical protein
MIMLKELINIYIKEAFDTIWYYARLEYQNRGTIHSHILFKSRNEPKVDGHVGLIELGKLMKKGYFAARDLRKNKNLSNSEKNKLMALVDLQKRAE